MNELAIEILEMQIEDLLNNEPEYMYTNRGAWIEWSNAKNLYSEILQEIQDGGDAYSIVEEYMDKMLAFSNISESHGETYLDQYYICECLLEMLCEEQNFYWNQHY